MPPQLKDAGKGGQYDALGFEVPAQKDELKLPFKFGGIGGGGGGDLAPGL